MTNPAHNVDEARALIERARGLARSARIVNLPGTGLIFDELADAAKKNGQDVKGYVCGGWFKGLTIRIDE